MAVHKVWVVIYSSEELPKGELARRLDGLEWWVTDRDNYEESKEVKAILDLTQMKD